MMKRKLQDEKLNTEWFRMALTIGEGRLENCPDSENFEAIGAEEYGWLYERLGFPKMNLFWEDRPDSFFKMWGDYVEEAWRRIMEFVDGEGI